MVLMRGSLLGLDIVSKLSIISFEKETIISYRKCFDNSITIVVSLCTGLETSIVQRTVVPGIIGLGHVIPYICCI